MKQPDLCVLYGGVGGERAVSLASGKAVIAALEQSHAVHAYDIQRAEVPAFIDPSRMIVMPVLHGQFGENGVLQDALDDAEVVYAGCAGEASAQCMDKVQTKQVASRSNLVVAESVVFDGSLHPSWFELVSLLGDSFVIKPADAGSSVGLHFVDDESGLLTAIEDIQSGKWMAESRVRGYEVSVGVLDGKALGVVGIRPQGGAYDYKHKYTPGYSEYDVPACLVEKVREEVSQAAETIFEACGCRDFARVDFIINGRSEPVLLEVNTLPGLTPTSLLPKSASCEGIDFNDLLDRMLAGAVERWKQRYG